MWGRSKQRWPFSHSVSVSHSVIRDAAVWQEPPGSQNWPGQQLGAMSPASHRASTQRPFTNRSPLEQGESPIAGRVPDSMHDQSGFGARTSSLEQPEPSTQARIIPLTVMSMDCLIRVICIEFIASHHLFIAVGTAWIRH